MNLDCSVVEALERARNVTRIIKVPMQKHSQTGPQRCVRRHRSRTLSARSFGFDLETYGLNQLSQRDGCFSGISVRYNHSGFHLPGCRVDKYSTGRARMPGLNITKYIRPSWCSILPTISVLSTTISHDDFDRGWLICSIFH